ncbi:AAEL014163-PA [Aedes aegypti]|uniref:AAEL014163-PA n=2 Tax=Aedes aegypti TaxID=7159 RepID=Q16H41_AEDAE|nr:AAEL014163-PA [Aedes aegypti]
MKCSSIILLIAIQAGISNQFKCGVPQQSTIHLIVNGFNALKGRWPWHVAIYHKNHPLTAYVCGGTLISSTHILTAAHCVINPRTGYQIPSKSILMEAGAYDLNQDFQGRQRHSVKAVYKMANYTRTSPKYDVAILELDSEVEFNQYVQPACVYSRKDLTGKVGTVVGWGITETNEVSSVLKEAELPVVDTLTCLTSNRYVFGPTLEKGMFCAGYVDGTSVCNGDSGGGIFFNINGAWHVGGIVSYKQVREGNTALCRTDGYAVFTKLYDYLQWISTVTGVNLIGVKGRKMPDGDKCEPKSANAPKIGTNAFPRNCGIYSPSRIIFGRTAKVFEFPWMAILLYKNKNLHCVGTLINKRYVLTSALCVQPSFPEKVRLGEHTRQQNVDCNEDDDCAPPVRDYQVECVVRHQNYNHKTELYNIALIRLKRNVLFEDHIQPICLPLTKNLRSAEVGSYIITGWGTTEENKLSLSLKKATILAVSGHDKCRRLFAGEQYDPKAIYTDQFCTVSEDSPAYCYGDGGGPLGQTVRFNGMRFVQFGIFSNGWGECHRSNILFTRVGAYMDWILANVRA